MLKRALFSQFRNLILDKNEENFDIHFLVKSVHHLLNSRFFPKRNIFKRQNRIIDLTQINTFPLKPIPRETVMKGVVDAFNGMIRWSHPYVMHNITPPVLKDTVAIRNLVNIYNPNCLWDFVSGEILHYEDQVGQQMANLFKWDTENAGITFTFGGKATLLYAIRAGINRCKRESVRSGISGDLVVITSENTHYSIEHACILLGIGKDNCIRITNNSEGNLNLFELQKKICDLHKNGKRIAAIILSGGNSLDLKIDPVAETSMLVEKLKEELGLDYRPYIHFDTVIGWAWMSFSDYNFSNNPLGLKKEALERICIALKAISEIKYADSAGIDYHKTGLCPYITSAFIVKNKKELLSLNLDHIVDDTKQIKGEIFRQYYTIEHSRSAEGILSAWISIQELGIEGYQKYIGSLMNIRSDIENHIDHEIFTPLNSENGLGFAVVIRPCAPNRIKNEAVYAKKLFHFFNENAQNTDWAPVVGFVPEYKLPGSRIAMSALKLYPMYPLTNEKDVQDFLSLLYKIKSDFDSNYQESLEDMKNEFNNKHAVIPK